ncbi:uncharacterized protein [Typha latifolia]|uniref:uncharacterized protein isoform X1 n=1 Tax=Typha latifolia TaxID=4733 RepID=UPI003C2C8D6A
MPTDQASAPDVATVPPPPAGDVSGEESTAAAKSAVKKGKRGGMHKLFKSAFKRGETSTVGCGDYGGVYGDSAMVKSGAAARPPSGRQRRKGKTGDDSNDGERSEDSGEHEGSVSAKLILALRTAKIHHAYESYPWEKKMRELLPLVNSSCFLSLLLLPKAEDVSAARYNSVEDTLARADTWLISSQNSGVPIVFMNVQTEALLTKISGETASSTVNMGSLADLANMANVSLYGFEDYHGVDIGVVRAVRLWYTPIAGELAVEIKLQQGDTRLGFAISRTEEGFIYVSSVAEENSPGVAATRSGLRELYREARKASKLLVISRVGNEKVLPWMVATSGDIKCFDTVSLSQKLSLHRHALRPILLHFLLWDDVPQPTMSGKQHEAPKPLPAVMLPPLANELPDEVPKDMSFGDGPDLILSRDSVGDSSFRFQNISLPDSWV